MFCNNFIQSRSARILTKFFDRRFFYSLSFSQTIIATAQPKTLPFPSPYHISHTITCSEIHFNRDSYPSCTVLVLNHYKYGIKKVRYYKYYSILLIKTIFLIITTNPSIHHFVQCIHSSKIRLGNVTSSSHELCIPSKTQSPVTVNFIQYIRSYCWFGRLSVVSGTKNQPSTTIQVQRTIPHIPRTKYGNITTTLQCFVSCFRLEQNCHKTFSSPRKFRTI